MIILTNNAVNKIKEIANQEEVEPSIRVKIIGGGCSGFKFDIIFDDIMSEADEQIIQDGIKIFVDQISAQYLDKTTIDYIDGIIQSGFKFMNPNVKNTCGCGNSVVF